MFSLTLLAVFLVFVFLLQPLTVYLIDAKRLRRFPNQNVLSGITNLGYMIERWGGFRSKSLHETHKNHPIVRIGPNSLSFSTANAIKAIYGHSTPCVKGDMYAVSSGPYPNILDSVDKGVHAHKRRLLSHAFATRNLEQWEFKIVDKVERLVRQFDRICSDADVILDYRKWTNLFTLDAIVDIALSHRLGCLDRGDDMVPICSAAGREQTVSYIGSLHAEKRAASVLVWSSDWFRPLQAVLRTIPGFFRDQYSEGQGYGEMIRYLTRRRIERYRSGEELDDFLRYVLQDKEGEPRDVEIGEVEAEVNVLLDAGSDTTAIALSHAMYYLVRYPSTFHRLRQELDSALQGSGVVVPYSQVKDLPYLRACLDESLRLSPPSAAGLNRKTGPEGMWIDGEWIPGNTTVSVPAYTAHRNPAIFPEPEEYRPERWLGDGAKGLQGSFIAFSAGARGCIGRNITYMEQLILIATLVRRFDFALIDPEWKVAYEEAFLLWPTSMPLKVRLRS